jgi:Glu-tRNA(Gln) amidotransferase subunit E-like FAD-binding protein
LEKLDQLSGEGKRRLEETEHLILSKIGASYGMSADEAKRLIGDNTTQLKKQLLDDVDRLMETVANGEMFQYFEKVRRYFAQLADFVANVSRKTVDFIVRGLALSKQVVHDIFQQIQNALTEAWRQFIHWY